ncbi:MAG: hypothetical protein ABI442_04485 [Gemmatimonadaceae bacterium]
MRRTIVAVIIALAAGYSWGFDEGAAGKESIVARTLDRFGTSKIKEAQEKRERQVQDASKP